MSDSTLPAFGWFYANGKDEDQRVGPVSLDGLRSLWETHCIDGLTLVWCEAMTDWQPVGEYHQLKLLLQRSEASVAEKVTKQHTKPPKKRVANSVYVSGLPTDTTLDEVACYFSKCGILKVQEDGETPKIKLYSDPETGELKGDALVTYFKSPSVALAIDLLDDSVFRKGMRIHVQEAEFKSTKGEDGAKKRGKRWVDTDRARKQQRIEELKLSWADEGDLYADTRWRIVIIKGLFKPDEIEEENTEVFYKELEAEVKEECVLLGPIEKVTIFQRSPEGVAAIRFKHPEHAAKCIKLFHERWFDGRPLSAHYFDGVSDYRVRETKEEEATRIASFERWIDSEE